MIDENGVWWKTAEEVQADHDWEPSEEDWKEVALAEAEHAAWLASPEGQKWLEETRAARANPDRLSNRVDMEDLPLIYAQAVQAIYDETQKPCFMRDAQERAGMDTSEVVVAAAIAHLRGLVQHPERDGLTAISLWEPVVG